MKLNPLVQKRLRLMELDNPSLPVLEKITEKLSAGRPVQVRYVRRGRDFETNQPAHTLKASTPVKSYKLVAYEDCVESAYFVDCFDKKW